VLKGRETATQFATRNRERRFDRTPPPSSGERGVSLIVTRTQLQQATEQLEKLAPHDPAAGLRAYTRALVDPFALGHGARTWIDTTPENIAAADGIHQVFPTSRIIHTIRDGRDVAASMVTKAWGPDTYDEALDLWATRLRAAARGSRDTDPQRLHLVRLEELIHLERDREFDRIVAFLGITDHAPLRAYFDRGMIPERAHVGRWRKEVDPSQTAAINTRYRELYEQLATEGLDCLPTPPDTVDEIHHSSISRTRNM
jgi:hypothetical protein